ncbi:filamentous hemagglutinin N-terminal domain-containing protein [filamentous cyanobacterium LEGE 11480]|uniref:Filamentous hemagglutinin N-terminal domain-containing protein n=1 Tax=Romeriopsis navalis LEGE 11480 TaxID=2777977 RepID=A0A928Z363_9CYAN|nr:filamentous hemagglutinin N-terminal domain-containing protein [Romeriopsis navalis]MBE9029015.1 filamentous hemagglutinin N-terminal domain-containing protein [Romeriopsis navalis LEGE 11480]
MMMHHRDRPILRWSIHHCCLWGMLTVGGSLMPSIAMAQITPTTNWGGENSRLNPAGLVNGQSALVIEGGATRGNNLFHSFQQFNVANVQRVYFANPANTSLIFSRVVGGQPSNILGTLGVNGLASLFLLNPQGVIFGPNAQLDIRGAFTATTANAVQFGNQGTWAIAPTSNPPLLSIAPSALTFAANQGAITSQSQNLVGAAGQSLLLLGRSVQLNGGNITVPGGRVELGGINGDGTLALQQRGNQFEIVALQGIPADVTMTNATTVNLRSNNGGDFVVGANNFTLSGEGTQIQTGLADNVSQPNAQAGNVDIQAINAVTIQNSATIDRLIPATASGGNGQIRIEAKTIDLLNGGRINSTLEGRGGGGIVSLKADVIRIDEVASNRQSSGIQTGVESGAVGTGSDVTLQARLLQITNGGRVETDTAGTGDAGNITIDLTGEFGSFGLSAARRSRSGIGTFVERNAIGNSGKITINADSVLFQDGAKALVNVAGQGQGKTLAINTIGNVILDGAKPFPGSTPSGLLSLLRDGAVGRSGDIKIRAESLIVQDGAAISTDATGQGDSGNVDVVVRDLAVFDGASPTGFRSTIGTSVERLFFPGFSFVGNAAGQAGTISVTAREVQLTNGGYFASSLTDAPGAAGKIIVNATENVIISGTGTTKLFSPSGSISFEASSGLFTETSDDTSGAGGEIRINSPNLDLSNAALINSLTSSRGPGGNITLNVPEINISGGAQVRVTTLDTARAGDILLNAADRLVVSGTNPNFVPADSPDLQPLFSASAILADTQPDSSGPGGILRINAGDAIVQNQGTISVSSQGQGAAGLLDITARSLLLKDRGSLTAGTSNATGGNINLNLQAALLLRNASTISTTAGTAQAGGDGGNIQIRSPFIVSVPNENSDITANAFSGQGGQVSIDTLALFGLIPRSRSDLAIALGSNEPSQLQPSRLRSNDITAISQIDLNLSGDVRISQLDVDPTQSAARLPDDLLDRSDQINQSLCRVTQGSQFILTGRGGRPTSPIVRQLTPLRTWEDIRFSQVAETAEAKAASMVQMPGTRQIDRLTEAQSWYRSDDGKIHLAAKVNRAKSSWMSLPGC